MRKTVRCSVPFRTAEDRCRPHRSKQISTECARGTTSVRSTGFVLFFWGGVILLDAFHFSTQLDGFCVSNSSYKLIYSLYRKLCSTSTDCSSTTPRTDPPLISYRRGRSPPTPYRGGHLPSEPCAADGRFHQIITATKKSECYHSTSYPKCITRVQLLFTLCVARHCSCERAETEVPCATWGIATPAECASFGYPREMSNQSNQSTMAYRFWVATQG